VFCSTTHSKDKKIAKRLGRRVSEEEKTTDFHILDYEPDLVSFKQVSCNTSSITAVD
jgi:hypothetical protein